MFSFISASFAILLAASQVAAVPSGSSPSVAKRITGCDGLGSGTVNTLFTFRLTASGGTNKGEDLVLVDSGENVGDADIFVLAVRQTRKHFLFCYLINMMIDSQYGPNSLRPHLLPQQCSVDSGWYQPG